MLTICNCPPVACWSIHIGRPVWTGKVTSDGSPVDILCRRVCCLLRTTNPCSRLARILRLADWCASRSALLMFPKNLTKWSMDRKSTWTLRCGRPFLGLIMMVFCVRPDSSSHPIRLILVALLKTIYLCLATSIAMSSGTRGIVASSLVPPSSRILCHMVGLIRSLRSRGVRSSRAQLRSGGAKWIDTQRTTMDPSPAVARIGWSLTPF